MTSASHVLIVEDSDVDYDVLNLLVGQHGLGNGLRRVCSGEDALRFLRQRVTERTSLPSLMLMDLNLTGISGTEVLRQLRADPDLAMMPVIVLSTSRNQSDVNECYSAGANTYLVKPFRLEEFEATVAALVKYWFAAASLPDAGKGRRLSPTSKP